VKERDRFRETGKSWKLQPKIVA